MAAAVRNWGSASESANEIHVFTLSPEFSRSFENKVDEAMDKLSRKTPLQPIIECHSSFAFGIHTTRSKLTVKALRHEN
jgi:hypothetical protein